MDILGPDAGTIEILGQPADHAARDRIGYMPEERGLYPRMVLEEQLVFMAEIKGVPRAEARERARPVARAPGPRRLAQAQDQRAVEGHAAEGAVHRHGAAPARGADPGRADERPRPRGHGRDARGAARPAARGHARSCSRATRWRRWSGCATASRSSTAARRSSTARSSEVKGATARTRWRSPSRATAPSWRAARRREGDRLRPLRRGAARGRRRPAAAAARGRGAPAAAAASRSSSRACTTSSWSTVTGHGNGGGVSRQALGDRRREYLERVRSKAFMIATVLGPLLMGGLMIVPALMARRSRQAAAGGGARRHGHAARGRSSRRSRERRSDDDRTRFVVEPPPRRGRRGGASARCKERCSTGSLDGYLSCPPDALERRRPSYYGRNVSNFGRPAHCWSERWPRRSSRVRLTGAGLDPRKVERPHARARPEDDPRLRPAASARTRAPPFFSPSILMMMLYTTRADVGPGRDDRRDRGEDEPRGGGDRLVDPVDDAAAGKLLGVGAAGLTQFLVWALSLLA